MNATTIWSWQTIDMLKINMYFSVTLFVPENVIRIRNVLREKQTSFRAHDKWEMMFNSWQYRIAWGGRGCFSLLRCETSKLSSKLKSKVSEADGAMGIKCDFWIQRCDGMCCVDYTAATKMDIMWCHVRHRIRPLIDFPLPAEMLLILGLLNV